MTKKILFFTGDFTEDYETMVPFQMLEMLGYEVHTVSPDKKKGDKIKTAIHEAESEDDQTFSEKPGHKFKLNYDFDKVKTEDYVGLCIAGGRAPEHLRTNKRVLEITREFAKKKLPIAAVCHGIQILSAADVIEGKKITGFKGCASEVEHAKGKFVDVPKTEAVVDENFITAPSWPAHQKWIGEFAKVLGAKVSI